MNLADSLVTHIHECKKCGHDISTHYNEESWIGSKRVVKRGACLARGCECRNYMEAK